MVAELQDRGSTDSNAQRLAKGLGYFSIGLGLAGLLAPRAVASVAGMDPKNTLLIRLFGLREIGSGIAIFAQGRRPAEECYEFWRNFEQLPDFMHHLQSVKVRDNGTMHWVTKGPAHSRVSWDAEVTEDRPNHLIAWRSMPGSKIDNRGVVRFERAPADRGTILRIELEYCPPAGSLGLGIAKLFREEPKVQIKDDLRRFKQVIETGEVVLSDASPKGNGYLRQRSAQPQ